MEYAAGTGHPVEPSACGASSKATGWVLCYLFIRVSLGLPAQQRMRVTRLERMAVAAGIAWRKTGTRICGCCVPVSGPAVAIGGAVLAAAAASAGSVASSAMCAVGLQLRAVLGT